MVESSPTASVGAPGAFLGEAELPFGAPRRFGVGTSGVLRVPERRLIPSDEDILRIDMGRAIDENRILVIEV